MEVMKFNMRTPMVVLIALGLTGCAQSVSQTMGKALSSAPDWFDERRDEVSGEGYPEFSEVPESEAATSLSDRTTNASEQEQILADAAALKTDPKAMSPSESGHVDPSEWASQIREELARGAEASE